MSTQDNTSIAAIVIATIAFFVTVGQLLQAIFGTAVGYRNCQASVIGEWAIHTKRKWRWREFRFETRFKTPNILLSNRFAIGRRRVVYLGGDESCRRATYVSAIEGIYENSDLVGWLRLLDQIHKYTKPFGLKVSPNFVRFDYFEMQTYPAITFRERSWDFMPPEITRPFATSNVGDIIVLAHRLGMFWTELRPADGSMRAEGNGFSIVSTTVRGFGLFLQFTNDEAAEKPESHLLKEIHVPTAAADKLGFQIIPGARGLGRIQEDGIRIGLPDFAFEETNRVNKVWDALKVLGLESVQNKYCKYMQRDNNYNGFSDLLPLVAPFMPLYRSSIVKLIPPHATVEDSPFRCKEGFGVFWSQSKQPSPEVRSKQIAWVHETFDGMRSQYGMMWMEGPSLKQIQNTSPARFIEGLRTVWDKTTSYFQQLERKFREPQKAFNYSDLVGSQMLQSVSYPDLWEEAKKPNRLEDEDLPSHWDARLCFAMQTYIDRMDEIVKEMARRGFHDLNKESETPKASDIVRDAWWTLALRAMCWHRAVSWVSGPRPGEIFAAPPQFYGSKIPVFIA